MIRRLSIVVLTIFSMAIPAIPSGAEEVAKSPTLEKGIGAYKHENYEEALPLLMKAREEDPDSTLAAYYLGLDYKQLQNYRKAIPNLRDAVSKAPKIKGALIELIDCLYNYNELDEANKWIDEAQREGIRPAQVDFLKGLVLVKEERYEEAIASFEQAKERDPSMAQSSDYQIGIAQLKAKEFDKARKTFEMAADLLPSSDLAKYANEYVDAIAKRKEALKPWRLNFTTAWQYDDNVVLKPENASAAANIADQADSREIYNIQVEGNHRFNNAWGLKGQYNFYYGKQNDLDFYDTMVHSLVVQPSLNWARSLLAFPMTYSHTMVDDRSYLSNPSTGVLYNFSVGESQMGQVFVKGGFKDYLWTPLTPNEDRDGGELSEGMGWYWFFAQLKGFFNLRSGYDRDWTEGVNWDSQTHHVDFTVLLPVKEKLNVSLAGGAAFQDFLNTHTVFSIERQDQVYTASTLLTYELCKYSELQLQYTYIKDRSNIDVFEYNRNIYSAGVQLKF